ncbi:hypothetical protein RRG08_040739 [Elysia crispata]|uniref:Uncharacterized protein n=1 Tax=Elysia crispata TaxID=231223 RepID=A0AAE1BDN6_9GAST|nr:hypothetical protein RRG08_040739 [Elysia crispata]
MNCTCLRVERSELIKLFPIVTDQAFVEIPAKPERTSKAGATDPPCSNEPGGGTQTATLGAFNFKSGNSRETAQPPRAAPRTDNATRREQKARPMLVIYDSFQRFLRTCIHGTHRWRVLSLKGKMIPPASVGPAHSPLSGLQESFQQGIQSG